MIFFFRLLINLLVRVYLPEERLRYINGFIENRNAHAMAEDIGWQGFRDIII